MADALDAAGMARPSARALVNKREVEFELATGRILDGPPALVGKWICLEQMADILAHKTTVIEHLFTADTEDGLRLAKVDYLTARAKEERGEFAVGSHVQYGKHGVFLVKELLRDEDKYVLTANGREITVDAARLVVEAKVVEQGAAPTRQPAYDPQRYRREQVDGGGTIEIDDGDLNTIIEAAVRRWLDEHKTEIIASLAHHTAEGGNTPSVQ